jgi:O-antigen/teichoic acid export membrane protein
VPLFYVLNMSLILRLKSLASHSAVIMMSRLGGAGIGFLTQFALVKLMGAHQLGLFYAASSLAAVLGVIAAQGYPQIAARFVGRYRNKQNDLLCGSFISQAWREGLAAASVLAVGVIIWAAVWPGLNADDRATYAISGVMLLAVVTLNILTNVAGGMRDFALSYMPEGLFRPILFFVTVIMAAIVGVDLSASLSMLAFMLITAGLAVFVTFVLVRKLPTFSLFHSSKPSLRRRWRREGWQLIFMAVFTNFFADVGILVVVPFLTNTEVAVFGLCLKLALLVGYFVQIGQQMVVPDMADARHKGDHERVRRAAWRSIGVPTAITLASIMTIYFFGDRLLAYFGAEFADGRRALLILLIAQLLRAVAGPSSHLLTLSGIQSINLGVAASSIVLLCVASASLSPLLGIEGAAYAVLLTYAYWIGISAVALRRLREPSVDILRLSIRFWQRSPARG